jgi:transcriptional regulator with XRE-family HTH domain
LRKTDDTIAMGERLRRLRLLRGLPQHKIGDALGVSFQAVQKWETGENRLSAEHIASLAKFFGVSVGYFFFDDAPADAAATTAAELSARALVLAGRIDRLAPHHKHAVGCVIDALSGEAL